MTRLVSIVLWLFAASPAVAAPVPNRLSLDPYATTVEQLDLQILRFVAESCRFPTGQDTMWVEIDSGTPVRLLDARDAWGQPFVFNAPAVHGDAQFDLYSIGPDGIDDQGRGDDIANWRLRLEIAQSWAGKDDLSFWDWSARRQRLEIEEADRSRVDRGVESTDGTPVEAPKRTGRSVVDRLLRFDAAILIAVAVVWRRRLGLVALLVAILVPATAVAVPEQGAIYRYTESQVYYLRWSVLDFRATHCRYPSPADSFVTLARVGLDSLATLDGARDYWGRKFVVRRPSATPGELFDLYSVGRNGIDEGGAGDDIGVDTTQEIFETQYLAVVSDGIEEKGDAKSTDPDADPGREDRDPDSSRSASVGRWLARLDAPFVLFGILWIRARRSRSRASA